MAEDTNIGQVLLKALGAGLEGYATGVEQKRQAQNVNAQQNYENQIKMQEAQQNKMLLSARLAELDANIRKSNLEMLGLADKNEYERIKGEMEMESQRTQFETFQKQTAWAKAQGVEQFRAGDLGVTFPTAREQGTGSGNPPSLDQRRGMVFDKMIAARKSGDPVQIKEAEGEVALLKELFPSSPEVSLENTSDKINATRLRELEEKLIPKARYAIEDAGDDPMKVEEAQRALTALERERDERRAGGDAGGTGAPPLPADAVDEKGLVTASGEAWGKANISDWAELNSTKRFQVLRAAMEKFGTR